MIIEILLIVTAAAYITEIIVLIIGINLANRTNTVLNYEPMVSIIVAARNEEEFIADCLTSLTQLEYPKDKLELIIVNDRSTDKTPDIIESFEKRYPNIKTLTTNFEGGNLRGKTNAIAQGADISTGEILMFTDADCKVPRTWVSGIVKYFDEETGIVGGFTVLESKNTFERIQYLDWLFLFGIASGAVGLNIPLTIVGNNLSVRRSAYQATGGYRIIPFSVTEDYALVQAVQKLKSYKIKFPINSKLVVRSQPCKTLCHLFHQRQRWSTGGLDMIFIGKLIASISWFISLLLIVGIYFTPKLIWVLIFFIKFITDYYFINIPSKQLQMKSSLKDIFIFEIYLLIYVIIIPFIAIFSRKIIWKERTL